MKSIKIIWSMGLILGSLNAFSNSLHLIVKYKQSQANLKVLKSQLNQITHLQIKNMQAMANGAYILNLNFSDANFLNSKQALKHTLATLNENPAIEYAVEDKKGFFKPVPEPQILINSPDLLSHENQWDEFRRPAGIMLESVAGMNDGAWAYTKGMYKQSVVVAVLDTGFSLHDALKDHFVTDPKGSIWGWNFAGNDSDISDETNSFHGTHVAGTIAGYSAVMSGVGKDLKILPLKISNAAGMFYESSVINAIYWSVGAQVPGIPANIHPAKVLNMSFGVDKGPNEEIDYCDQALQDAVNFARSKNAVLVVAAGNDDHWEHFNAPGICSGTIKVASTGPKGLRSYFSNYGPSISLAAPGGDKRYGMSGGILSTVNPGGGYMGSGYDFYQGTSMATPHVAAVAGLVISASDKDLDSQQVEQILTSTTHNFGVSTDSNNSCVGKKPCGPGILDAENAVKAALANYDLFINTPHFNNMKQQYCMNNASSNNILKINNLIWKAQNVVCVAKSNNENSQLVKTFEGKIIVYSRGSRFELEQSAYKSCDVIGDNGVGCTL